MDKEMMYCCDFSLLKVGFNQLINRLSFMRNGCFVLAVSRIEKQSVKKAFKQSVDDINYWYICDFLFLETFDTYLNTKHKNIKFTYEKQIENKLPFLDTLIKNNENLQTSVLHKKTYAELPLNYFSFVPDSYKYGLIKALIDRMYRINSTWTSFDINLKNLKQSYLA